MYEKTGKRFQGLGIVFLHYVKTAAVNISDEVKEDEIDHRFSFDKVTTKVSLLESIVCFIQEVILMGKEQQTSA